MSPIASLTQWPPSQTTVMGIAGLVGAGVDLWLGSHNAQVDVPLIAGALTAIVLPDNGNAKAAAQKLAADAVAANAMGNAPVLVTDATALEQAIVDASPPAK